MDQGTRISAAVLGGLLAVAGCGGDDEPGRGQTPEAPAGATAETACGDGADNDGDGHVDCADLDCRSAGGR